MTNDTNNEDLLSNEQIDNNTQRQSQNDKKKLEFMVRVYYVFITISILMLLSAITLSIGFTLTVVPDELDEKSREYAEA